MFDGCLRKVPVFLIDVLLALIVICHAIQAVIPLAGLVAVGWILFIVGFGMDAVNHGLPVNEPLRYPWWMMILVTPFMLAMALVQAAIDKKKFVMKVIGAIVSCIK